MEDHHLYEIVDSEKNTTYKYGISLRKDGSSPRAVEQTTLFNRVVGKLRFVSKVLITEIKGRKAAKNARRQAY